MFICTSGIGRIFSVFERRPELTGSGKTFFSHGQRNISGGKRVLMSCFSFERRQALLVFCFSSAGYEERRFYRSCSRVARWQVKINLIKLNEDMNISQESRNITQKSQVLGVPNRIVGSIVAPAVNSPPGPAFVSFICGFLMLCSPFLASNRVWMFGQGIFGCGNANCGLENWKTITMKVNYTLQFSP